MGVGGGGCSQVTKAKRGNMRNASVGCDTGPIERGFCLSLQIFRIGWRPERHYSVRISVISGNMSIWEGGVGGFRGCLGFVPRLAK